MKRALQRILTLLLVGILIVEPLPSSSLRMTALDLIAAEVSKDGSSDDQEAKKKAEEEAKKKAEEEAAAKEAAKKAEEEAKEKAEAEQKAKEEAAAREKAEAEQKAKEEAAAKEAAKKAEEEAKEKAEAEQKAKEEAAAKEKAEAEQKAKEEAAAKEKAEADKKAKEEAAAKEKAEADQKAKEEAAAKEKAEADQKAKEEAAAGEKAEADRAAAQKEAAPAASEKTEEDGTKEETKPVDDAKPAVDADQGTAEKAEKEKAEEKAVEMPAKNFKGEANGMTVLVKAQKGTFPKGTEMKVKSISSDSVIGAVEKAAGAPVEKVKAVDISFYYEGKEIQPKKSVEVTLKAPGMNGSLRHKAFHINDGHADVVDGSMSGTTANFSAKHFSPYAIGELKDETAEEKEEAAEEPETEASAPEAAVEEEADSAEEKAADTEAEVTESTEAEAEAGTEETAENADAEETAAIAETTDPAAEAAEEAAAAETTDPAAAELTTEDPAAAELTTEDPAAAELTTEDPAAAELTTEDPAATELTTEEPAEEIVEMPAKTFTGSANGVSVTVKAAEGTFPAGTTMKVAYVSAGSVMDALEGAVDGEIKKVRAVDITFEYEGREIQPEKPVKVMMNASGMDASLDHSIIHINDHKSGAVETVVNKESMPGTRGTFEADSFSIYVVVEEDQPSPEHNAVATYEFYVGDELKQTQYVKNGDMLADPGDLAGDGANFVFKGWYIRENGELTDESPQFGTALTGIEVETTIEVAAKVEQTYYVTFWGEKGSDGERGIVQVKTVTVTGEAGAKGNVTISDVTVTPKTDTSAFEGWSLTDDGEVIAEDEIEVGGRMDLYAVIVEANWIHFDENIDYETSDSDATYTGPVAVKKTDNLADKKPADPTRRGYTFGGWYEDKDCTTAFSWSGTGLDNDITLYAKWVPADATYTVIIWKQKVTDAKDAADADKTYDFESNDELTGTTGETLEPADFSAYTGYNFTGFHFGRTEIEPETVRADGSTVVNIYYDRNLLTIHFYDGSENVYTETTSNNGTQYGKIDDEYVSLTRHGYSAATYYWTYQEPHEYTGTTYSQATGTTGTQYGFSDGQMQQLTYRGNRWYLPNGTSYNGTRYREGATGNSGYGIVDGDVVGISHNDEGWNYTTEERYTGTRYIVTTQPHDEVFTGLYGSTLLSNGYTWPSERAWYQNPNGSGTRLTFLDAFKFEGLSGTSENNTVLSQYGQNNSGTNNIRFYKQNIDGTYSDNNPTNTVRSAATGTFTITEKYEGFKAVSYRNGTGGWTNTSAGGTASANNLQIRFERQKYSLTFVIDNGKETTVDNIPYEDVLSKYKIADPDPEESGKKHYNFAGWYEDPSGSKEIDWSSTMPAANKVVYAKWVPKQYHVSLDPNGGTIEGTQYSEFNVDLDTILDKNSLFQNTKRDGYELVGWFYKNSDGSAGSVYDYGKIEEDVNLIAKWRYPGQVRIVYVAAPHGSPAPEDKYLYATDSSVVLAAPPKTIDKGWEFYAWEVAGKKYYPNNTFDINEDIIEDYDQETKTGTVTITALYNDKNAGPLSPTTITFDPGDHGTGTPVTVDKSPSDSTKDLLVNEKIEAKSLGDCGFTAEDGYEFKEWNTDKGGEGLSVNPGDMIAADLLNHDKNTTDNTLYAIWIPKLQIRITGETGTKEYTGSEQSVEGYTVEYKVGAEDWTETAPTGVSVELKAGKEAKAKGTDVNEDPGYPMGLDKDSLEVSVPDGKYKFDPASDVEVTDGWLKITPADLTVTITGNTDTLVYNGSEQSVTGYEITIPDGATLTEADITGPAQAEAAAKGTDVDGGSNPDKTYPMGLKAADFDTTNKDYTVTFEVTDGWLKITPADLTVTITGNTDSMVYNGQEQSVTGYEITIPDGATLTEADITGPAQAEAIAKGTDVDGGSNPDKTYPMGLEAADFSTDNKNYNVTFEVTDGWLKITPKEVTITAKDASKAYDGQPLTQSEFTTTNLEEGDDHEFAVVMTEDSTIIDVGEQPNVIATVDGVAVTADTPVTIGNYIVTTTNGKLTITQDEADFEVSSGTQSWTYDGKLHTYEVYTVKQGDSEQTGSEGQTEFTLDNGDVVTIIPVAAGVKNVSDTTSNNNKFELTVTRDGSDTTGNYKEIVKNEGTLTINPKSVTITAKDAGKVYDGQPLTQSEFTASALAEGDDHTFVVAMTDDSTITNAGEQPNVIGFVDGTAVTTDEATLAGNYLVSIVNGTLKVTKKAVTITAADSTKVYGTEDPQFAKAKMEGNVEGELGDIDLTVIRTNSEEDVATYNGVLTIGASKEDLETEYTNYTFTIKTGNFKITQADIEDNPEDDPEGKDHRFVVTNPEDVVYNGKEQRQPVTIKDTVTGKDLAAGTDYSLSYSKDVTNVGTVMITITAKGNYKGTITRTYKITPLAITVKANDGQKVYDGKALKVEKDGYKITAGTPAEGETEEVTLSGEQTLVGSSPAKVDSVVMKNSDGKDVTKNYKITKVDGTLKVTDGTDPEDKDTVDDDLVVTKTVDDTVYKLGETVKFTVTVTNIYDKAQKITLTEIDGVKLETAVFEDVAPGKTVTTTASYKIKEADILAKKFVNTVTAEVGNVKKQAEATAKTEAKDPHLTVEKTVTSETPENGYAEGDTIEYKIVVTNDGNVTISDIVVTDGKLNKEWKVGTLAPGQKSKDLTASYKITKEDAESGEVVNVATATGTDPEDKDVPVKDGSVTVDVPVELEVLATITYKLNGGTYDGSTDDIEEYYPDGTEISIHEAPTREGYEFDYWKGSEFQPGDKYTVNGDHTFVAQWKEVEEEKTPAKKKAKKSKSPRTGDDSQAGMWLLLMMLAAAGTLGTVVYRKRNRK